MLKSELAVELLRSVSAMMNDPIIANLASSLMLWRPIPSEISGRSSAQEPSRINRRSGDTEVLEVLCECG